MTQKNLAYLLGAALVLTVIYVVAVPGTEPTTTTAERKLFAGVNAQAVSAITLEQGPQSVKLELKDGTWVLPERNNYPADNGKIRALLLKIFDLSVSQKIPSDAKSLEKLAVSDEAVKSGFGHVVLSDSSGNAVAGLRLGEARKSKDKSPMGVLGGQFVRKDGEQDVYLLGAPLTLNLAVTSWLDVNLINLLPSAVRSIMEAKNTDSGQTLEFELERSGANDSSGLPQFTLKGGVPEGKALQDPVLTQIRGGLENLRISDVQPAAAEAVKELVFDQSTFYRAMNGLVYRIDTAQKDTKYFAKLSVTFDPALAEEIKKEAAEKAAAEPSPTATPAPAPASTPDPAAAPDAASATAPTPTATPKPKPESEKKPELTFSNEDEAKKLTAQYGSWVYELPAYSARKFRYSKTELIEPPPPPPPAGQGRGAPGGMPAGMPPGMMPEDG